MRTLFACFALLVLPTGLRAQVAALVIGHGSPQQIEQATAVAEALRAFAPDATVRLLVGAEATAAQARGAWTSLVRTQPSGILVYISAPVHLARFPDGSDVGSVLLEGSAVVSDTTLERALRLQPLINQAASLRARHVVFAIEGPHAGLAPARPPILPDTFVAVVAGTSSAHGALAETIAQASDYHDAIRQLAGRGPGIRLSLHPGRAIPLEAVSRPRSATLVFPSLPSNATAAVDGQAVSGSEVTLSPGDHTFSATLNGTYLWLSNFVLQDGETRRLTGSSEDSASVRLVRAASVREGTLTVNDVVLSSADSLPLAAGRFKVGHRLGNERSVSSWVTAPPRSVVEVKRIRSFNLQGALLGSIVPGLVPFRQGQPFEGGLMAIVVAAPALGSVLAERTHRERLRAQTDAQAAYDAAVGEHATQTARAALLDAHTAVEQSQRRRRLFWNGLGVGLSINALHAFTRRNRIPRLRITITSAR
ncbi:MAG: hypothetical protein LCH53_04990 [Bacteroidetes bacterium]|nr:hypothetical protein [Bacteroidota bacterium]